MNSSHAIGMYRVLKHISWSNLSASKHFQGSFKKFQHPITEAKYISTGLHIEILFIEIIFILL